MVNRLASPFALPLENVECESPTPKRSHYEPTAAVRSIRSVVACAAEGDQLAEFKVGAALGPLEDMMDIQMGPASAGLTAPARPD